MSKKKPKPQLYTTADVLCHLRRSPVKLAELAYNLGAITEGQAFSRRPIRGPSYKRYAEIGRRLQQLKRDGKAELMKGTGGGWRLA